MRVWFNLDLEVLKPPKKEVSNFYSLKHQKLKMRHLDLKQQLTFLQSPNLNSKAISNKSNHRIYLKDSGRCSYCQNLHQNKIGNNSCPFE